MTLALGIGATTAIFSAVQSVVLRPLPFPQPDRLVSVYENVRNNRGNVSAGIFVDGIVPVTAFSAVAAEQFSSFNLSDTGDTERVIGGRVTASFFDVFNLPTAHGRVFTKEEDQPGREQVVVLSHGLWARRFGSDPAVVGRRITLNERPYDVIGVMPARFNYTANQEELWVPIAFTAERKATHDEHYLQIYGRLKPDATQEQALNELGANAQRLRAAFPRHAAELDFTTVSVLEDLVGDYSRRMFTLLGAVGFVLLIACGNVANLLLARGAARAGELAIRAALGAGRGRIARQLLTESVVLAVLSAIVGLGLAAWGIRILVAAAPDGVPRLEQTTLDPFVLAFTFIITLLSAMLFGVAPAMRAARVDVQTVIKEGGRGAGMGGVRDRLRTGLIVAELAVALVLLVGAGLLIRSSLALQRVNPGFDPSGVLSTRFALPAAAYPDRATVVRTFQKLAEAAARIPGVTAAAITTQVPMGAGGNGNGLIPEGVALESRNAINSRLRMVTPGYFETMRIPIVKGRPLTDADRQGAPKVMVISEALARAAFPEKDPIGKRIACCEPGPDGKSPDYKTVVGVAGDVRSRALGEAPAPEFYLPIDQVPAVGVGLGPAHGVHRRADGSRSAGPVEPGARYRPGPGARSPRVSGEDDGAAAAGVDGDRAIQHDAAVAARSRRAGARRNRGLRRHRVLRDAPHPGDRRSHGARGLARPCACARVPSGGLAGGTRDCRRRRHVGHGDQGAGHATLRRVELRPGDVRCRGHRAGRRGAHRQPDSRHARGISRSNASAASELTVGLVAFLHALTGLQEQGADTRLFRVLYWRP